MPKSMVVVESPAKARTIAKYLGREYEVKACVGHIRDLPQSASEIPARYKKEPWARIGINIAEGFEPLYIIPSTKKQQVRELKAAVKQADRIYFATDEDREGESISWHLLEVLKPKVPVKRLVFHEITATAIRRSLETPRDIDKNLVEAQETRRVVDRLFGYEVSPLLWKKMAPRLSAGRVQSVAVRLLVQRERQRIRFRKADFWGVKATFVKEGTAFEAGLTHIDVDKRVAVGKHFDPKTGRLKSGRGIEWLTGERARELAEIVRQEQAKVTSVERKPYSTAPPAPFITSTLQQEANRKLRWSAKRTMSVAQRLYQNGFITYMRTDSTTLSQEGLGGAARAIELKFGKEYLSEKPRLYRTQATNAQEAHEAIRPAGADFREVAQVRRQLGSEAAQLYKLVWQRMLASQMKNAQGTNSTVVIQSGEARFSAKGKTVEFAGFLMAYALDLEAPDGQPGEVILPKLVPSEPVETKSVEATEHSTQPPGRYSEGNLIRELERRGIGRPSTWATIVDRIQSRSYAFKNKKGAALIPTFTAFAVVNLLEKHFTHLVDYTFTAKLEDGLDLIARGEANRLEYLRHFYFGDVEAGLQKLIQFGETSIEPRKACLLPSFPLGKTEDRIQIQVRIGRFGPFISDGENTVRVPDQLPPDELTLTKAVELLRAARQPPESLGIDSVSGLPIFLKKGRFGPYVALGEASNDYKPKMASLLPGKRPEDVDLEYALKLLALPRNLGRHPDSGEEVISSNGRYGAYVKSGDEIRSIPPHLSNPLDITLEQAVGLLRQPKSHRRSTSKPVIINKLGKHPVSKKEITLRSGRYGPYVTDGELNASLPKGTPPQEVTIDDAVGLLQGRADRLASGKSKRPRRRAIKKKATRRRSS